MSEQTTTNDVEPMASGQVEPTASEQVEQTSDRPITPKLIREDNSAGKFLALMLSGLFLYTIFAMGYCVYLTMQWTS